MAAAADREEWIPPSRCWLEACAGGSRAAGGGGRLRGPRLARVLSLWCVLSRLVAELRDALDSCAERQRQLERSLRVSRRLLRAWYADPGTTRLGLPRAVRTPLSDPGPGAHFGVAGCQCSPLFVQALRLRVCP